MFVFFLHQKFFCIKTCLRKRASLRREFVDARLSYDVKDKKSVSGFIVGVCTLELFWTFRVHLFICLL